MIRSGRYAIVVLAAWVASMAADRAAFGDVAADYEQWKAQLDEASKRVGNQDGPMKTALGDAERPRFEIGQLAGSIKDRASQMDSSAFHVKFLKGEWEQSQREAKRLSDARDAKYKELQDEIARMGVESKRLDDWWRSREAWNQRLDAWWTRIKPMMRTYETPREQAGFNAALAAKAEYDAEAARCEADRLAYNADIAKFDTWRGQLKAIENFVLEQGKASLEGQAKASKKEREYVEAAGKLAKLEAEQSKETQQFYGLMAPARAAVQAVLAALNAPAIPVRSFVTGGTAYVPRTTEAAAQATGLAPSVNNREANPVRDRIFVMAPANTSSDPVAAQAEMARRKLQAELAAAAIAKEYTQVPAGKPVKVAKAPDSIGLVRAPEGFAAGVPVGPAESGSGGEAVVMLTDEMLSRPLDPRVMITDAEYASAKLSRERMAVLIPNLRLQLAKLKGLRKGTLAYEEEFENIRAEAVRGALRDSLSLMGTMVTRLGTDPKMAKMLTPEVLSKLEIALSATQAGVGYEHSTLTREAEEKRKQQLETIDSAAETLLAISKSGLPEGSSSKLMIEQMGNMLKVYNKTSRYLMDPKTGTRPNSQEYGEMAKLGIGVAAVFATPVAIGVGVESLGERGLERVIIQEAMVSLSESLKKSYDAERFLTEKVERLEGFQVEMDRTIHGYEEVSAGRRSAMHIGNGNN